VIGVFAELIRHICHQSLQHFFVKTQFNPLRICGFSLLWNCLKNGLKHSPYKSCEIDLASSERHVRSPLMRGDVPSLPLAMANL